LIASSVKKLTIYLILLLLVFNGTAHAISTNPVSGGNLSYFDGWKNTLPSQVLGQSEPVSVTSFSSSVGDIVSQTIDLYKAPINNGACEVLSYTLSLEARQTIANSGQFDVGFDDRVGMLQDGYCHQFILTAVDSLGNSSSRMSSYVLKYDVKAPVMDEIIPDDGSFVKDTTDLVFDFYDLNPLQQLELLISGPGPYDTSIGGTNLYMIFPASAVDTLPENYEELKCLGFEVVYTTSQKKWVVTLDTTKTWDEMKCGINPLTKDKERLYPDGIYNWNIQVNDFLGNHWGDISNPTAESVRNWGVDNTAPIGGLMNLKTKLGSSGININTPDSDGVYLVTKSLSLGGADDITSLSLNILDINIDKNQLPAFVDGEEYGEMIYDADSGLWEYMPILSMANLDEGQHDLSATFLDLAGFETTLAVRFIIDRTAPIIRLNGSSYMTLEYGERFNDPGAKTDDGSTVTVAGLVNTKIAGSYTLTYSAIDLSGNEATPVYRTVVVKKSPHKNDDYFYGEVLGDSTFVNDETSKDQDVLSSFDTNRDDKIDSNQDIVNQVIPDWYWWILLFAFAGGLGWRAAISINSRKQ